MIRRSARATGIKRADPARVGSFLPSGPTRGRDPGDSDPEMPVEDGGRGLEILGGAVEDEMAVVEDIGALGDRERGGDILLHDDDGLSGLRQPFADGEKI